MNWLNRCSGIDTKYYIDIAYRGYSRNFDASVPSNHLLAHGFFPLYPILIRLLSNLTRDYVLAGVLVSNVALFLGSLLLYDLVREEHGAYTAANTLKILYAFPMAFILSCAYSEALFLALAISCFYFAKKQQWLWVGSFGFFAATCRPIGAFLFFPMVWEYFRSCNYKQSGDKLGAGILLLIPLGLYCCFVYQYRLTGDIWAYIHTQQLAAAGEGRTIFPVILHALLGQGTEAQFDAWFLACTSAVLLLLARNTSGPQLLFAIGCLAIPLCSLRVEGMARYSVVAFPLFTAIGRVRKEDFSDALIVAMGILQGCLVVFWCRGYPVFG